MIHPIARFALVILLAFAGATPAAGPTTAPLLGDKHTPQFIQSDGAMKLAFGEERIVPLKAATMA